MGVTSRALARVFPVAPLPSVGAGPAEAALLDNDHRAQQQIDRGNDQDDGDEDDDSSQHFHGNSPGRQVNCDHTTFEQYSSTSTSTVCRPDDPSRNRPVNIAGVRHTGGAPSRPTVSLANRPDPLIPAPELTRTRPLVREDPVRPAPACPRDSKAELERARRPPTPQRPRPKQAASLVDTLTALAACTRTDGTRPFPIGSTAKGGAWRLNAHTPLRYIDPDPPH
ncbi:hypothetical protein P3H15_48995 [Rhodococcus sp. T2V]|uniref:hypothetical protein n=1 Tax=Rhodococcus sp. T2V TaxID=3034164 RepID=UPI0023E1318C|nr:hypothetical protein [Rhodococcus sp. T2V]MDF3312872.1 hypothetical protein [Rhodococcus sp. T2V]